MFWWFYESDTHLWRAISVQELPHRDQQRPITCKRYLMCSNEQWSNTSRIITILDNTTSFMFDMGIVWALRKLHCLLCIVLMAEVIHHSCFKWGFTDVTSSLEELRNFIGLNSHFEQWPFTSENIFKSIVKQHVLIICHTCLFDNKN